MSIAAVRKFRFALASGFLLVGLLTIREVQGLLFAVVGLATLMPTVATTEVRVVSVDGSRVRVADGAGDEWFYDATGDARVLVGRSWGSVYLVFLEPGRVGPYRIGRFAFLAPDDPQVNAVEGALPTQDVVWSLAQLLYVLGANPLTLVLLPRHA